MSDEYIGRDLPGGPDNTATIHEFRAHAGRVGGYFAGMPMVLIHHRGRKSGREYVNPVMCLPDETKEDTLYVFASNGGAPANPDWYYNLIAAGRTTVEWGAQRYTVTVRDIKGSKRDRIYEEQAQRLPGFTEYAEQAAGFRTIPVLELQRA